MARAKRCFAPVRLRTCVVSAYTPYCPLLKRARFIYDPPPDVFIARLENT